jgi:hypothetical protein
MTVRVASARVVHSRVDRAVLAGLVRGLVAATYRDRGPQAHQPTGSAAREAQDSHSCRTSGSHRPEPPLVATIEPTSGELAASHAECHAQAAASGPLTLEQSRQVRHVSRPHGSSVDVCAHEHEATQTWS